MSKYIDGSKHAAGTAAVEHHFFASDNKESVGEASGKQFLPGMTSAWDTQPVGHESGQVNNAPTGAPSGPSMFNDNIANPMLPRETGVNYTQRSNAGHTTRNPHFQGVADGMTGNIKLLWD